MLKSQKTTLIANFSKDAERSKLALIFDFKGLKVKEMTNLRKMIAPTQSKMQIIKNTLAKRALQDHPEIESVFSSELKGTNAFVFTDNDICALLNHLTSFKREDQTTLPIKKAFMKDYGELTPPQMKKWANLPPEETLRVSFLALLQNSFQKFLSLLQATPLSFVCLLKTYKERKEKEKPEESNKKE